MTKMKDGDRKLIIRRCEAVLQIIFFTVLYYFEYYTIPSGFLTVKFHESAHISSSPFFAFFQQREKASAFLGFIDGKLPI